MKSVSKFEAAIGSILVIGVVCSLILEVVGITLFYFSYGHLRISETQEQFIHGANFFQFLFHLFGNGHSPSLLLMTLGIAVLMLTPYIRVILSFFYFLWARNTKYIAITAFVLVLLTISLATR